MKIFDYQQKFETDHAEAFNPDSLGMNYEDRKMYLGNRMWRAVDYGYCEGVKNKVEFTINKMNEALLLIDKSTEAYTIISNMIKGLKTLHRNPETIDYKPQ